MTRAELIALIEANVYPNARNEVTAPMVRNSMLGIVSFLGDAATYGVGAVAQGNDGLVTGGAVWAALGGGGGDYALKTTTITGTGYLDGGGNLSENRTLDISSAVKGKIDHGEAAYNRPVLFEADGSFPNGIKTASGYTSVRVPGVRFGAGRASLDLEVINVAEQGATPVYALYSPLPLITGGDQIVGSGTPGGGGGGGRSYLHELLDVYGNPGNVKRDPSTWADPSVPEYAQAGDLLKLTNISGVGAMWTAIPQSDIVPDLSSITALIPSQASPSNQLADKAFVNSSIQTATATYQGSYNLVTDLGLTISATQAQIGTALASAISGEDNNDYAFVQIPTADATPTEIARTDRYKYNGTSWVYEYTLNNSGFTAAQWAAINSNITATKVTSYDTIAGYFTNGLLQSSHVGDLSGTYLPLTGGTLQRDSDDTPLRLQTGISGSGTFLQFKNYSGNNAGYLGVSGTGVLQFHDSAVNTIYHSGNSNKSDVRWSASDFRGHYLEDSGVMGMGTASAFIGGGETGAMVYVYGNNPFKIWTNGYARVTVNGGGNVGIGTTSPSYKLHVAGLIASTGDQVITSDINKKTHFQGIRVTLDQIADAPAVSFDWKDGSGHSFGSIAQYWKPIVPEAVLGKEGDYSLAYSQLDAVLVINLAREVRALRKEVERLRGN